MEEMRDKENPTEPQNSKNKFANQFENYFNFFRMVTPKPTLYSIGEGTAADIVLTNTHEIQPLCFIS